MLNPFYLYSIIWSIVLLIYKLDWSDIYPNLSQETLLFFVITIILSITMGFVFGKKIKIDKPKELYPKVKISMIFIILGNVLQYIYVGKIPLIEQIRKTGYSYVDFPGIPTFHVILLTYTSYYAVYLFYLYLEFKNKKYLISFFICNLAFILLYNRGMIVMIAFMSLIIFISIKKIKLKNKIKIFLFGILFLYGFGISGNMRHYSNWNDTSYLASIGKMNKDLGILNPFFWSYIYITSPVANLEYNIQETEPKYDINKLVAANTVPDFIKKRIPLEESKGKLIVSNLNVSSGFLPQYLEGGILGMYFMFFIYSFFNIVYTFFLNSKSNYYPTGLAILCCVVTFSFFGNMYTFSGLSFQLIYPLLFGFISRLKWKKYNGLTI